MTFVESTESMHASTTRPARASARGNTVLELQVTTSHASPSIDRVPDLARSSHKMNEQRRAIIGFTNIALVTTQITKQSHPQGTQ